MRPTSPYRKYKIIDKAISTFITSKKYTSLRSINEMDESAYKTTEIQGKKLVSFFFKNQNMDSVNKSRNLFPKTYFANGYVDILKTKYILKNKKIHGNKVYPFFTTDPFDIDSLDKLKYFEFILKH